MMRHRHLDYAAGTPARELGRAALDDLLDRGDLDDWAPVLREIRRDPRGSVADSVLHLSVEHPLYGTSKLWRSWVEAQRAAAAAAPSAGGALRRLRRELGLTQQELGERLGMTQPEVSKLERRDDVRLSTMRAYVAALGASLGVVARFESGDVDLFETPDAEPPLSPRPPDAGGARAATAGSRKRLR